MGDWHVAAHNDNGVGCADCHKAHDPRDPVRNKATQVEVCKTCHQLQVADSLLPFAHPVREGQIACSSCHSPHGSLADASLKRDTINETCYVITSYSIHYTKLYEVPHPPFLPVSRSRLCRCDGGRRL